MIHHNCQKQLVRARLKVADLKQKLRHLQPKIKEKQHHQRSELAQFLIDVNSAGLRK